MEPRFTVSGHKVPHSTEGAAVEARDSDGGGNHDEYDYGGQDDLPRRF